MVALVGSPVVKAVSSLSAFTIDLPAGAAAGDSVGIVWMCEWDSATNWVEPPLAVGARGNVTGMSVGVQGPSSANLWSIVGSCSVVLNADDIIAGTYGLQAANTLAYDGSSGTYSGDLVAGICCWSDGYVSGGGTGYYWTNFGTGTQANAGIGVVFALGRQVITSVDPTTTSFADFAFVRGSDGHNVEVTGYYTYASGAGGFARSFTSHVGLTAGSTISFEFDLTDAVTLTITNPASITLAGGVPTVEPPLLLTITTPEDLALAGAAPTLYPVEFLTPTTPANLTLAGGVPTLTPTGAASVTIDTPANLALAGGVPTVSPTLPPATLTITAPANLALAGGTPAVVGAYFIPTIEADAEAHVALTPPIQALPLSAVTAHDAMQAAGWMSARVEVSPPVLEIHQVPLQRQRLLDSVVVTHSTPVISNGKPVLPKYIGLYPSAMRAIVGQTDTPPDHIHSIPDPDPIWNPATSGWYYPPPSAGVGDCRWTVQTLPDPAPFPSQYYWLGDPSSADGTSGIASGCRQWAPDLSTPGAPSWHSKFPYKPSVRAHVQYGQNGQLVTQSKGVRFNLQYVEHMWASFAAQVNAPFTWVIVGIIMDFPNNGYTHTLLDVGGDPNSYGAPGLTIPELAVDHGVSDLRIDNPYRPALQVNLNDETMIGDLAGSAEIVSPFNYAAKPKMWFGVWNGATSLGGSISTTGKYIQGGTMPTTALKNMIIGRRGGIISRNWASHLVVFEMRCWFSALVEQQLDDQYAQLSSTFQFGSY